MWLKPKLLDENSEQLSIINSFKVKNKVSSCMWSPSVMNRTPPHICLSLTDPSLLSQIFTCGAALMLMRPDAAHRLGLWASRFACNKLHMLEIHASDHRNVLALHCTWICLKVLTHWMAKPNICQSMPTFLLCVLQSGKFITVLLERCFAGDRVSGIKLSAKKMV